MAANTTPLFVIKGAFETVLIDAANTAADGSGTLYDLITGATDGTRIEGVGFIPSQATVGAVAAKVYRIFKTDTSGLNPMIVGEVAMAGSTRSNTAVSGKASFLFDSPLILKSGEKIQVCQSVRATAADNSVAYTIGAGHFNT